MDKYLQNMKTFHILLISFFNLKALLASICLKKDYVAFQIKGFLDKRIEDCGIQQVPTHLHIQLQCTKSLCAQSGCQSAKFHSTTVTRLSPHWFAFGTDPIGWQVPRCEDRCPHNVGI